MIHLLLLLLSNPNQLAFHLLNLLLLLPITIGNTSDMSVDNTSIHTALLLLNPQLLFDPLQFLLAFLDLLVLIGDIPLPGIQLLVCLDVLLLQLPILLLQSPDTHLTLIAHLLYPDVLFNHLVVLAQDLLEFLLVLVLRWQHTDTLQLSYPQLPTTVMSVITTIYVIPIPIVPILGSPLDLYILFTLCTLYPLLVRNRLDEQG